MVKSHVWSTVEYPESWNKGWYVHTCQNCGFQITRPSLEVSLREEFEDCDNYIAFLVHSG